MDLPGFALFLRAAGHISPSKPSALGYPQPVSMATWLIPQIARGEQPGRWQVPDSRVLSANGVELSLPLNPMVNDHYPY